MFSLTAGLTTCKRESDVLLEIDAKQAPRIFLPTITRDKNSFAFQSREPALGPREKNSRIREYSSLPSNSIYTATLFSLLLLFYDKFKLKKKKKRKSNPQNYLTKTIFFSSKTFSPQRKKSYDSLNAWRDCNNQINKFFLLAFSSPITRQNLRSR